MRLNKSIRKVSFVVLAFLFAGISLQAQWIGPVFFPPTGLMWTPNAAAVGVPGPGAVPLQTSIFCNITTGSVVYQGTTCTTFITNPNLGAGARFMWIPGTASIRSGCVSGTQWDFGQVGCYSVAMGQDVIASSVASVAMGVNSRALQEFGIALGEDNLVQGPGHAGVAIGGHNIAGAGYATAIGGNNQALADFCFAAGEDNHILNIDHAGVALGGHNRVAQGYGVAIGEDNHVTGGPGPHAGVAIGGHNIAAGGYAVALGSTNISNTDYSYTFGRGNNSTGDCAFGIGCENTADGDCTFAVGCNISNVTTNSFALGWGNITLFVTSGHVGINYTAQTPHALHVNGTSWTTLGAWSGSDARYKTDVEPLASGLDAVMQLKPVSYNWNSSMFQDVDVPVEREIGFIAQDLERVVPEVVRTNSDGYKGVAYEDLTAVLARAIQEQQHIIDAQKADNEQLRGALNELLQEVDKLKAVVYGTTDAGSEGNSDLDGAGVYLNDPNPFSGATTIGFNIPANVAQAELVITEAVSGRVVKRIAIDSRGKGSELVSAEDLGSAGTYFYSLVLDGQTVGTKKMMLSK